MANLLDFIIIIILFKLITSNLWDLIHSREDQNSEIIKFTQFTSFLVLKEMKKEAERERLSLSASIYKSKSIYIIKLNWGHVFCKEV
jgi:uncharacterized tellurite resistance protein B-like protein